MEKSNNQIQRFWNIFSLYFFKNLWWREFEKSETVFMENFQFLQNIYPYKTSIILKHLHSHKRDGGKKSKNMIEYLIQKFHLFENINIFQNIHSFSKHTLVEKKSNSTIMKNFFLTKTWLFVHKTHFVGENTENKIQEF